MGFLIMDASAQKPAFRHLVLWLTTECNLSCVYCYRGYPKDQMAMSRETALAALELAAESGQPFHVQLAGGEPTLEPGLIEYLARAIRYKGLPATLAIQTNAVALTSELVEMLRRWNIGVGVSLDGSPEVNGRLRGKSAQALHGMEALERAGVDFNVTTVVSAANVMNLPKLALLLGRYVHAQGLGLDLLINRGKAAKGSIAMADTQELHRAMQVLFLAVAWVNRTRRTPLVLREVERMKTGASVFCHAAAGASLAVHPDGRLYPCGQTMGDDDVALGTIDNPDFSRLNALGGLVLGSGQCVGCSLEGRCPGECPSRLKYNGRQGHELACAMLRGLAEGMDAETGNSHEQLERGHAAA
jgi:uncharacterized protein